MKKILILITITLFAVANAGAQVLKGYVYDSKTREPLVGAAVSYQDKGNSRGTTTDINGFYELGVPAGGINVAVTYLGYNDHLMNIIINSREVMERDVYMVEATQLLGNVVVSASRNEQRLSDVTVSMDVLAKSDIGRQAPTDLTAVLNTLSGVEINEKQPSIRGGAGWTYGVGSRSLILVDGMSVLSPGTGEINWNIIPIESIAQVEVLKGASSVLYGSSALNGLINIRTERPGLVPKTNVKFYAGIYGDPKNKDYIWWDKGLWKDGKYEVKPALRNSIFSGVRNPMYEGLDISHSRRIGDFDVSGGLSFLTDEGFRYMNYNKRFNINGNVTYHQPTHGDNIINYGANFSLLSNKYGDYFIWRSITEAYQPSPFTTMAREGNSFYIDPFFNFTNPDNNTSHKVKARVYYRGDNITSRTTEASLIDMLGKTGTYMSLVNDIMVGDYSSLTPLADAILQADLAGLLGGGDFDSQSLNGIINAGAGLLRELFPNGSTSDLTDLIAWFMQNGLPSGLVDMVTNGTISPDLISWAANAASPKAPPTQVDHFYTYYLDYQFSKTLDNNITLTAGTTYQHDYTKSYTTGTHQSDNIAVFFQYDQRFFDRLSVSLGMRGEYYRVDDMKKEAQTKILGWHAPFKPVFRGGINYQLAEYSFLRASFGQGYRYPSLTEKYARRDIGGAGVYPNFGLNAERGFNAEIGIKQGYKIGGFMGFFDFAAFYTEYKDMVEFRIGLFNNDTYNYIDNLKEIVGMVAGGVMPGIGAQFYNVKNARIYGIDVNTQGFYNISPNMKLNYTMGYVYTQPEDTDYKKKNALEATYTDPLEMKEKSNTTKYLKYRQKHIFKTTLDFEWNRITIGTNLTWKSRTLAVDYVMVDERPKDDGMYQIMDYVRDILFGNVGGNNLESYWKKHNKGYFVMDTRFGVKVTDNFYFQFMINNLLNKEHSVRPMAISAPRTFIFQLGLSF